MKPGAGLLRRTREPGIRAPSARGSRRMLDLEAPLGSRSGRQAAGPPSVALTALVSAVPPHVLRQQDVARRVRPLFGARRHANHRLLPAFGTPRLGTRWSCRPILWHLLRRHCMDRHPFFTPPPFALTARAAAGPPHVMRQEDVVRRVRALFGVRRLDIERLLPAFGNAGIDTRRSCVPIEWYLSPSNWKDRNALFIEHAVALLEEAASACLAEAGLPCAAVDGLGTVCTTGIATPSPDARPMERLPFPSGEPTSEPPSLM